MKEAGDAAAKQREGSKVKDITRHVVLRMRGVGLSPGGCFIRCSLLVMGGESHRKSDE